MNIDLVSAYNDGQKTFDFRCVSTGGMVSLFALLLMKKLINAVAWELVLLAQLYWYSSGLTTPQL